LGLKGLQGLFGLFSLADVEDDLDEGEEHVEGGLNFLEVVVGEAVGEVEEDFFRFLQLTHGFLELSSVLGEFVFKIVMLNLLPGQSGHLVDLVLLKDLVHVGSFLGFSCFLLDLDLLGHSFGFLYFFPSSKIHFFSLGNCHSVDVLDNFFEFLFRQSIVFVKDSDFF
jgi:hypothetical protein